MDANNLSIVAIVLTLEDMSFIDLMNIIYVCVSYANKNLDSWIYRYHFTENNWYQHNIYLLLPMVKHVKGCAATY